MSVDSDTRKTVAVIGAGICGVSTAIWLQRYGHNVILMDKGKPGMATSYGNAGLLAHGAVNPVTSPELLKALPGYLANPNSPLFLKWRHLPKLAPWLIKLLSNATDSKTRSIVKQMDALIYDSVAQHKALVRDTPLEKWIVDSKLSFAYKDEADFQKDAYDWEMKASVGLRPNMVFGEDVKDVEPILGKAVRCLAVLEGHGHITNPGQYITELSQLFTENGGVFMQTEVRDVQQNDGHVSHIETEQGRVDCDYAVITAGIWSKEFMNKLGLDIPMESERGYHVIFKDPSELPRNPMIVTSGKFGVTPMDMGLRCAGTVELADYSAEPSKSPLRVLYSHAKKAFPNLEYAGTEEWMGRRPTPADCTPLIGEIGQSGIYTGFGHQHVGLTGGPKTGRLIAQLISGESPNIDMSPYSPERFSR